ncbi:MAG: redoxin domain-containing protein [Helicobacteraceae bacterium]
MKKIFLALFLAAAVFTGCSDNKPAKAQTMDLALKDIEGNTVMARSSGENRIKDLTIVGVAKPIVAVYWATYCPSCKAEIPHLIKLQEKYKDQIQIIGLTAERKDRQTLKEFATYHSMNYPIFYGDEVFKLAEAMGGVRGIPAIFIFDKTGKFHKNFLGLLPFEILESEIKALI